MRSRINHRGLGIAVPDRHSLYVRWIHTGDEVFINASKEVFIVDRIKELIKVRGVQVAPSELEGHLLDHTDIADVCVVGIPDEYSVELPFAFVVLSRGAQERIKNNRGENVRTRGSIMKVRWLSSMLRFFEFRE